MEILHVFCLDLTDKQSVETNFTSVALKQISEFRFRG